MKIKKLEICGFKSFVDKTVVNFDHDVLGIVGPNGCGKSNIVDAIRWCMGEQSAKNLRGRSMDDIIFNGSESRAGAEFAEVTLTFENNDNDAPIEYRDYPEIAVTRRLTRTGDSDYLINRTLVRLKDVTDLFLGTGVGSKAYSIIEQGKVGLIVSAKPEDRRMLIEEAAGITKYKARKKQAERKMEQTQQNLLRVGDIVSEIERNLGALKRQAAKAERFLSYRKELEDLQLHEASHRYLELRAMSTFGDAELEEASRTAEETRTTLLVRDADLETTRSELQSAESFLDEAQTAHYGAENAVRAEEAAIQRASDRLEQMRTRETAAAEEKQSLEASAEALREEMAGIEANVDVLRSDEREHAATVEGDQEALLVCVEEHRVASEALAALRQLASTKQSEVAAAEASLRGFERRKEEFETRGGRLRVEKENLDFEKAEHEGRARQLDREMADLRSGKVLSEEEKIALELNLTELKANIGQSERSLEEAKVETTKKRSRLHALLEVQTRLEGIGHGTKNLLATKDPAIRSLLVDRFEVPENYSAAVAGYLSARIEEIVVNDLDRGLELLRSLGEGKKGRATILVDHPQFVAGAMTLPLPESEGVLGRLVDLVRYDAADEPLIRSVFGNALLVEDVGVLRQIQGWNGAILTLEGTVSHSDGRFSGGTGDAAAQGFLDSKRETRELSEEVVRLDEIVSERLEAHQTLRSSIAEVQSALERARHQAHADELALVNAESALRTARTHIERIEIRLTQIVADLEEIDLALAESAEAREQALSTVEEAKATSETLREQVEEHLIVVEGHRVRVEEARSSLTDKKVALAGAREKLLAAEGALTRLLRSRQELLDRSQKLTTELAELATQFGTTAAALINHRETQATALDALRIAEDALSTKRAEYDSVKSRLSESESELRSLRELAELAKEQQSKCEMRVREAQIAMDNLLSNVYEKFRGLKLERVVGDYHLRTAPSGETKERMVELGNLLDRMGSVNLDAMKEHEEAEQRYTFYSTQKADLDKALADLEKAIAQMNRESRKLFAETFEAVNAKFQEIFPKMFRGGRASLRLTNPEDMLETGIDILAQPPGKKLASIELMSGGEKALTAVSLIFAIFQIKPSPFCILDEVDAPLDEANVTRYNDMVRSMTDSSQFILITHIKRTMQMVDVLYGVTMQESGVSRLVSVKLNESVARKEAPPASAAPEAAVA